MDPSLVLTDEQKKARFRKRSQKYERPNSSISNPSEPNYSELFFGAEGQWPIANEESSCQSFNQLEGFKQSLGNLQKLTLTEKFELKGH